MAKRPPNEIETPHGRRMAAGVFLTVTARGMPSYTRSARAHQRQGGLDGPESAQQRVRQAAACGPPIRRARARRISGAWAGEHDRPAGSMTKALPLLEAAQLRDGAGRLGAAAYLGGGTIPVRNS